MRASKETKLLRVDPRQPQADVIQEAAATLRAGGLVAFPTDTLYGLGANAEDPRAIESVFAAKDRPEDKPLIVLARDISTVEEVVVRIDELARAFMDRFWPGPLTLILLASARLPPSLTSHTGHLGVRVPASPLAQALLHAVPFPITAPSANRSGGEDPLDAQMVWEQLRGKIDLLLDGGPLRGTASTLLDLTVRPPRILRQGAIPEESLRQVLAAEKAAR